MGRGRPTHPLVPGWGVGSAAVAAPPKHKQNPGTTRAQAQRAKQPAQHRQHKHGRTTQAPSAAAQRYAQTWVLFTTAPTVTHAGTAYGGRRSMAETVRDWHSGWGVRAAGLGLPTEPLVERLIGVSCLAYTLQMHLGRRVSLDEAGQWRRAQGDGDGSGELVLVRPAAL